jgi:hypothetical protein
LSLSFVLPSRVTCLFGGLCNKVEVCQLSLRDAHSRNNNKSFCDIDYTRSPGFSRSDLLNVFADRAVITLPLPAKPSRSWVISAELPSLPSLICSAGAATFSQLAQPLPAPLVARTLTPPRQLRSFASSPRLACSAQCFSRSWYGASRPCLSLTSPLLPTNHCIRGTMSRRPIQDKVLRRPRLRALGATAGSTAIRPRRSPRPSSTRRPRHIREFYCRLFLRDFANHTSKTVMYDEPLICRCARLTSVQRDSPSVHRDGDGDGDGHGHQHGDRH